MAMQLLAQVEEEWLRKPSRCPFRLGMTKKPPDVQFLVGRQFLGQVIDAIQFDPPAHKSRPPLLLLPPEVFWGART